MKHIAMIRIGAAFLLLLLISKAYGADRYWIATGAANWNNTSNWSTTSGGAGGASVPGNSDIAKFDANGTGNCIINASVNVAGIDVGSGYTGTISQGANTVTIGTSAATFAGGTFTGGSAAMSVSATLTLSGTAFTSTSNVLTLNTGLNKTGGSFTHNNGTLKVNNGGTYTGSLTLYKLEFSGNKEMTVTISSGTVLTVTDELKYNGSSPVTVSTGDIHAQGNITLSNTSTAGGGNATITINGSGDQYIYGYGGTSSALSRLPNVVIDKASGILHLQDYLSVTGNWTYSAGALDYGTSTVIMINSKTISGSHELYNVVFAGATPTFTIASGTTLTVNGILQTSGTTALTINTGTIEAKGDITVANTGSNGGGTGTISITGDADQVFTGNGVANTGRLCNIGINKAGGMLTLQSVISCAGNWVYQEGEVDVYTYTPTVAFCGTSSTIGDGDVPASIELHDIIISTGTSTIEAELTATGDVTISSGATLTNSTYTINVGDAWNNAGTFTAGTGTVVFNGAGATQLVRKSGGTETFYILQVNKLSGEVQLEGPVQVSNSLILTKGNIVTTSTNLLTLNDNVTATGGSDASYVSGPMKKIGNEAFTFPLGGTSGGTNYYHPISITAPSLTDDAYTAEYFPTGYANDSLLVDSLEEVSNCEYWMLEITNGSSNVYGTVAWNANSCIANYADLTVAGWNGTQWTDLGRGEVTILDQNMGTINTSSAITFPVTNIPITIAVKKNTDAYALLKRKLDGGYYLVRDGKLMFRFDEEYNDIDNKLTFNIYDQEHAVIVSNASMPVASQPASDYGDNRISINILSCNISSNGNIGPGYYTLEVMNEKGEKWYLRFKHETSITNVCSTTGNGGGN